MFKPSARLFPIGFIISVDTPNFDPHDFYIDGNWERIKGRVIVGVDEAQTEFNVTGKTGGAKTHTLTIAQIPRHNHTPGEGSGQAKRLGIWDYGQGVDRMQLTTLSSQAGYPLTGLDYQGGGQAHNNLQPYQTAYMWKLISYSN